MHPAKTAGCPELSLAAGNAGVEVRSGLSASISVQGRVPASEVPRAVADHAPGRGLRGPCEEDAAVGGRDPRIAWIPCTYTGSEMPD